MPRGRNLQEAEDSKPQRPIQFYDEKYAGDHSSRARTLVTMVETYISHPRDRLVCLMHNVRKAPENFLSNWVTEHSDLLAVGDHANVWEEVRNAFLERFAHPLDTQSVWRKLDQSHPRSGSEKVDVFVQFLHAIIADAREPDLFGDDIVKVIVRRHLRREFNGSDTQRASLDGLLELLRDAQADNVPIWDEESFKNERKPKRARLSGNDHDSEDSPTKGKDERVDSYRGGRRHSSRGRGGGFRGGHTDRRDFSARENDRSYRGRGGRGRGRGRGRGGGRSHPPDWTCEHCGYLNFGSRNSDVCLNCDKPRGASKSESKPWESAKSTDHLVAIIRDSKSLSKEFAKAWNERDGKKED